MPGVIERVIDVDAPVEIIVALHPVTGEDPMAVWSVSARGVRSALQGLDADGVDTRQGPQGLHYFQLGDDECVLGRSLGRSPARIVCADRVESLNSLEAYALRGFPAEPLSEAAASVRVVAEPLQKQYGKELRGLRLLGGVAARQMHRDHPRFDSAISDAVLGVVDELVALGEDVQGLSFDLWDRDGAFEVDLVLRLTGNTSWTVGTAGEWVKAQGPAPELALRLPGDATMAGYFRQPPKSRCERLARVLGELGAGALEVEGVSRGTADKLARVLTALFAADRTVVYGTGPLLAEPAAKGSRPRVAWSLIGVNQDRKAVTDILDGFAAVVSDKQVYKLEENARHVPQFARKNMNLGRGLSAVVYEWRLPETVVSALEEGTQELAKEGVPATEGASMAQLESGYLAVMNTAGATWIAIATDREGMVDSLGKVTADVPRLPSSPEFADLTQRPALGASAVRLSALVDQMATVLSAETLKTTQSALATAPYRGKFPVTSFLSVTSGTATEIGLHARVPDQFMTDAAALFIALSAEREKTGSAP